jgi:hypothetical protein
MSSEEIKKLFEIISAKFDAQSAKYDSQFDVILAKLESLEKKNEVVDASKAVIELKLEQLYPVEEKLSTIDSSLPALSEETKPLEPVALSAILQQNMLVPENRDIIEVISVVPFDPGINVSVHSLRSYRARFLFSSYLFAIRFPNKDCRVWNNEKYPIDFLRIPWPPPRYQCRIRSIEFNPTRMDSAG